MLYKAALSSLKWIIDLSILFNYSPNRLNKLLVYSHQPRKNDIFMLCLPLWCKFINKLWKHILLML